jgi:hypothetical protein
MLRQCLVVLVPKQSTKARSRASHPCVPKQSLGTRKTRPQKQLLRPLFTCRYLTLAYPQVACYKLVSFL